MSSRPPRLTPLPDDYEAPKQAPIARPYVLPLIVAAAGSLLAWFLTVLILDGGVINRCTTNLLAVHWLAVTILLVRYRRDSKTWLRLLIPVPPVALLILVILGFRI